MEDTTSITSVGIPKSCPYLHEELGTDFQGELRTSKFECRAKPQIGLEHRKWVELSQCDILKCEQFWQSCPNYLYARQMELTKACHQK